MIPFSQDKTEVSFIVTENANIRTRQKDVADIDNVKPGRSMVTSHLKADVSLDHQATERLKSNSNYGGCPLTLRGHHHDGLGDGVLVVLVHDRVPVVVPQDVVLVQQLLQRRRPGQELLDHIAADVGRLLHAQLAQDLGLDGVQAHAFDLLAHVAGGARFRLLLRPAGRLLRLRLLLAQAHCSRKHQQSQASVRETHCVRVQRWKKKNALYD